MKLLSVSSIALPSLLLLPIIIQLFRTPTTILAQDFTTIDLSSCNTITNYTSGSWFEYNLKNLLFPTLISNGSVHGFFNTSSGRDSDTVYGLVQCRFDVLGDQCLSCLTIASKSILKNCPNKMDAIIYSEGCLLRYSNVRFFSQLKNLDAVDYIPWTWNNDKNISDQPAFNKQLKVLFNNLTSLASSKPSKYGTAFFNYNDLGTIYGLADCTQDLSSTDCMSCLRYVVSAIPGCCSGYKGARVISWSCQIWYRDYEFFTLPSASPDSPSPDKVSDTNGTKIKTEKENNNARIYMVVIPVVAAVLLFAFAFSICLLQRKATREKAYRGTVQTSTVHLEGAERNEVDVPFVDFDIILAATDNFSLSNKLGQGGFGPVYKGTFRGGQKMAVKRLSRSSGQGLEEFRNEVLLIAKLQHRNLVKLLGYCIKDDEKVLLYEYMPNKSLDFFIFDRTLCLIINWEKRLDIILGIARGILYLHQDSRLRIIHRDLKTSNILLDEEMNPKISDFGLARICGETQTAGSTNRVVGTYGYMAPEYALDGLFSAKSDVYSFGVVLLEIISGKKNSGFHVSEDSLSLISYAWRLWNENKVLDFIDHSLCEACNAGEVLKCIQVGLLCVQEDANDRPTISSVILMLGSKATNLPTPKQPAFVLRRYQSSTTTSSSGPESCSKNEITISVEEGR